MSKLRNYDVRTGNAIYKRFQVSDMRKCQKCGGSLLEVKFPPSYGGYSGCGDKWKSWHDEHYVCEPCKLETFFYVKKSSENPSGEETSREYPLMESYNGELLTQNDVWADEYEKKNGKPPEQVFF